VAISRAQLEQQIQNLEGGGAAGIKAPLPPIDPNVQAALDVDLSKNREKFGMPSQQQEIVDLMEQAQRAARVNRSAETEPAPFDFDKSFDKYSRRLTPFFSQSTRPTFYDMASDLGAAMLSADPTAGVFRSAGMGFSNFNERLRKDKESRLALDRQVGLQAMQMAMTDERAAQDFLNKTELERIKNSQKPYEPLIYEVPNPKTGELETVEVNPNNALEVYTIRKTPGAKQIKLPTSSVTVDSRTLTQGQFDKDQGKNLAAMTKQWRENAAAGRSQTQLTNLFLVTLNKLGPEKWGKIQAGTLSGRQILSELGLRDDKSLDDQQVANTLGTRLAMSLIALTKGAITEMEMRLFIAASPSLTSTYDGALKQAAFLQRIADLNIKKSDDYSQAVSEGLLNGVESDQERLNRVTQWESKWYKQPSNQFLTKSEYAELQELAKKEPEAAIKLRQSFFDDDKSNMNTDFSR
jgi:hypothetical protein